VTGSECPFEAFAQTRRAFCASFKILRLALPCVQYSVREGHMPWVGALVLNAFEFTIASTSDSPPHTNIMPGTDGSTGLFNNVRLSLRHFFRCCSLSALCSRGNHAGLQQKALKQDIVVCQEEEEEDL